MGRAKRRSQRIRYFFLVHLRSLAVVHNSFPGGLLKKGKMARLISSQILRHCTDFQIYLHTFSETVPVQTQ